MTLHELIEKMKLEAVTGINEHDISGCIIGDLLSFMMARVRCDNVWISVMGNVNAVAVASLTDCACILLCENSELDEDARKKAMMADVTVLRSQKSAYELACELHDLGV